MCPVRHALYNEPVIGRPVEPGCQADIMLDVHIPDVDALTMKCKIISVKYFVHVTLDIENLPDLFIDIPIVLTSAKVIEQLRALDKKCF